MSLMILGSGGYIGSALVSECIRRGIRFTTLERCEYRSYENIRRSLEYHKPELVVNCAAYVDKRGVDYNEDDKYQTINANTLLPMMLADLCQMPLMHFSTGCFYQGDNLGKGWLETDEPTVPCEKKCGLYVMSKFIAEHEVRKKPNHYIIRIRLPFDHINHPRNLLTKLQQFDIVVDETQSLTHRFDAVNAVLDMWDRRVPFGTYHLTNPGGISYKRVCGLLGRGWLKENHNFIPPDKFDAKYARTTKSRCVLNTEKLAATGIRVRPVEEAIVDAIRNWKPCSKNTPSAAPAETLN